MRSIRFALALVLASCASSGGSTSRVVVEDVGQKDGKAVQVFTLTAGGITAKITNYGTIVTELHVPDRNGKTADVVLGYSLRLTVTAGAAWGRDGSSGRDAGTAYVRVGRAF